MREAVCKLSEMSYFAGDLVATHIILFAQIPILLIPYADKWHTLMLFWLKPGNQIRPRILSNVKTKKKISGKLVLAHLFVGINIVFQYIRFTTYCYQVF